MQLKGIHYLIILIGALLLWYIYSLGKVVKEGFDDFIDNSANDKHSMDKSPTSTSASTCSSTPTPTPTSTSTPEFVHQSKDFINENEIPDHEHKGRGIVSEFIEKEIHKYEDKGKDFVSGFIEKKLHTNDHNKEYSTNAASIEPYVSEQQQQQQYSEHNNRDGLLGIPYSKIPRGQEDLYILKSQIVTPNCPICPSVIGCPSKDPPPPCPPCARCPEPSFECKKVPNYNNTKDGYGFNNTKDGFNNSKLPIPILTDFSQFGM